MAQRLVEALCVGVDLALVDDAALVLGRRKEEKRTEPARRSSFFPPSSFLSINRAW
jgi:hypothetical protein